MKIAYLITAYDNADHLNRLIHTLQSADVSFFIHIDKKSKTKFSIPKAKNVFIIENNIRVFWGSYTFIEAVQNLIEKSLEEGTFDYYVLLSGTDYPVRSNNYIQHFLTDHKHTQFINISKMPANNKALTRVTNYYISTYDKSFSFLNLTKRAINLCIRVLNLKRNYPEQYRDYTLYAGSTWWGMSGECIRYIVDFMHKNPEFVTYYKNTLIPEEMFFHTIVGNSKFMNNTQSSFTYADWPAQDLAHPVLITEKHIPVLAKEEIKTSYGKAHILFARKFSDRTTALLDRIDANLRSKND